MRWSRIYQSYMISEYERPSPDELQCNSPVVSLVLFWFQSLHNDFSGEAEIQIFM